VTGLAIQDVSVRLDGNCVVREVSHDTPPGGWLALIGPNGSGKSSLIRACAGLVRHSGVICAGETDLRALGARARARLIGYVPQEPVLPPDVAVGEYVLLGRTPHIGYFGNAGPADRAMADEAMERLDVSRYARRRLAHLSGGERQRVVLARALAQRPRVLLLDEPTSMLDIGHEQAVLDLVDSLRRSDGLTVVSALHDLTIAGQYADELMLLDAGRVAAAGTAAEVLTAGVISRVYAARVTVTTGPDGRPVVAPVRGPVSDRDVSDLCVPGRDGDAGGTGG
jgi:iron complex transport system ATP-binding protein